MSYDLLFNLNSGKTIDQKKFAAYFKSRPRYQVSKDQAVYQNEDTGIYFVFDAPADGIIAFNLNFFRPHTFGLEAALELEAFNAAYGLSVEDPQGHMTDGRFSRDAFLKGWNEGNQFGYQAMLKDMQDQIHTWPSRLIRVVWQWNYHRTEQQELVGEDLFVPTLFALEDGGEARCVVIWPPQCPILLPEVHGVLVPLAQRGSQSRKLALVPFNQILPVLRAFPRETVQGWAAHRVAFEKMPPDIEAFLGEKRSETEINGISMDQLLDRELVDKARRAK
jgi:hypothetical protein